MLLGQKVPGACFQPEVSTSVLLTCFLSFCLSLLLPAFVSVVQGLGCNRLLNCDGSVNCRVLLLPSYALGLLSMHYGRTKLGSHHHKCIWHRNCSNCGLHLHLTHLHKTFDIICSIIHLLYWISEACLVLLVKAIGFSKGYKGITAKENDPDTCRLLSVAPECRIWFL